MVVVTNATVIADYLQNIINYLRTNVTDPDPVGRKNKETNLNDTIWVRLKDGRGVTFVPQILVEMPVGTPSSTTTGLLNQLRNIRVGIQIHASSQIRAIEITDIVWNEIQQQKLNFFSNSMMFPTPDYLSEPQYFPHEENIGQWYGKLYVTFQYFHYS